MEHLDPEILHSRLPGIVETAKIFAGIDATKQPIPVLPTVHYNMGGIPTNYFGEVINPTSEDEEHIVQGLFAIGEAACVSVHGANRLGSNSLLDLVVFGRAAADRCQQLLTKEAPHKPLPYSIYDLALNRLNRIRYAQGSLKSYAFQREIQNIMQHYCSVFRTQDILQQGCHKIDEMWQKRLDIHITDRSMIWNTDLMEAIEIDNILYQSITTLRCALNRKESRGSHAREDYPDRDDQNWLKHSIAWLSHDGAVTFGTRAVHLNTLTDEIQTIAPKKRVY